VELDIVHVPTDTLVRYNPAWKGPLLGDKTWAALFDNSKVKRVAGDFECSEVLEEVLADSLMHLKKRLQAPETPSELAPLYERIVREQSALGA
jgi:hypothetical protein